MALDAERVRRALELEDEWLAELRARWNALADVAVWGRLESAELGALPRLRRRMLELGEKLAALHASRAWIPRPREQLKSALAAALAAKEAQVRCEDASAALAGAGRAALDACLAALRRALEARIDAHAARWAKLLDAQSGDENKE